MLICDRRSAENLHLKQIFIPANAISYPRTTKYETVPKSGTLSMILQIILHIIYNDVTVKLLQSALDLMINFGLMLPSQGCITKFINMFIFMKIKQLNIL